MYQIKEVNLINHSLKKKRLVITFHDEQMAIVGEFLMADASLMNGEVMHLLFSVIEGKRKEEHFSGNRCHLTIRKDETIIEDLFDEMMGINRYPTYTIETNLLYELTSMWIQRLKSYEI